MTVAAGRWTGAAAIRRAYTREQDPENSGLARRPGGGKAAVRLRAVGARFERLGDARSCGILAAAFVNGLAVLMSVYHRLAGNRRRRCVGWRPPAHAALGTYPTWTLWRSRCEKCRNRSFLAGPWSRRRPFVPAGRAEPSQHQHPTIPTSTEHLSDRAIALLTRVAALGPQFEPTQDPDAPRPRRR